MSVRAVIVGLPGAGKSTVGRLLARELSVPFADTDNLVVTVAGKSVSKIFADDGEAAFRKLEEREIARALHHFDGVLSLGGGAILSEKTRSTLADYPTILIDVPLDELLRRVTKSRNKRPLLQGDARANLERIATERRPLYESVAKMRIESGPGPASRAPQENGTLPSRRHENDNES